MESSSVQPRLFFPKPSLSTGWARGPDDSDAPEQWDGLVAAWAPFLGVQGSRLEDFSGYGNVGTLTGFTFPGAWIADVMGPTLLYDGVATYVSMGITPPLTFTGSFTVMTWFYKTNNAAIHILVSKQGGAGARGWQLYNFDNTGGGGYRVVFDVSLDGTATTERHSVTQVPVATWTHAAGVYDASVPSMDVYINGVLDSGQLVGTIPSSHVSSTEVTLGRKAVGIQWFPGSMNDTRVYNRALAAAEIGAIFKDPDALYRRGLRIFPVKMPDTTTTAIPPDAILASTNLTGAVSQIDEDPDIPDASWLTATSVTSATDLRVSFGSPVASPFGSQNFRILVRTAGSLTGAPPTLTAELRQNNVLRKTFFTGMPITSPTGQLLQLDWNSNDLVGMFDGSDIELRLVSIPGNQPSASPVPTYVGEGSFGASVNVLTPTLPAGLAGNDILLAVLTGSGEALSLPTPNGGTWTEVTGSPQTTTGVGVTVFWSRYNGTQGNPGTNNPSDLIFGGIVGFRGCIATGNPWDITVGSVESTVDATGSITGGTTSQANCLVVLCAAKDGPDLTGNNRYSAVANGSLANLTKTHDLNTNIGSGGGLAIIQGDKAAAGSISATTYSIDTSQTKAHLLIALKPPAGGTGAAESTVEIGAIEWNARYLTPVAAGGSLVIPTNAMRAVMVL